MDGLCPNSYYCESGSRGYAAINLKLLPLQTYACLISSTLSVVGAIIILLAYCSFKDLRKGTAQTIITLLALADLGAALGCLVGTGNILAHYQGSACWIFYNICAIQAFCSLWCGISSSVWSAVLAVHFLLATVFNRSKWTERLMPLYHIVACTLPTIVLLPLLISGQLGYTPTYQVLCYVSATTSINIPQIAQSVEECVVWAVVLLFTIVTASSYTVIIAQIYSKRHQYHAGQRIQKRLLAIPIAYLILRLGDIFVGFSGASNLSAPLACSSAGVQATVFFASTLQIVFDTGQGWVNCILFIFLSPELRSRMFVFPFRRFYQSTRNRFVTHNSINSASAPQLWTESSLSTQAKALKDGITHYPLPPEFP